MVSEHFHGTLPIFTLRAALNRPQPCSDYHGTQAADNVDLACHTGFLFLSHDCTLLAASLYEVVLQYHPPKDGTMWRNSDVPEHIA